MSWREEGLTRTAEVQAIVGLAAEDLSFFPKGNIEEY